MIAANIILFTLLLFIAVFVLARIIKARDSDSLFKKIMIAYFASEIFMLCGLLYLEIFHPVLQNTQIMLFIIFLPKGVAKIIFFQYLNKY